MDKLGNTNTHNISPWAKINADTDRWANGSANTSMSDEKSPHTSGTFGSTLTLKIMQGKRNT